MVGYLVSHGHWVSECLVAYSEEEVKGVDGEV